MKKVGYLIFLISLIAFPIFVKATECPNYINSYEIVNAEGNKVDKTYSLGDKLYMRVSFANVYTIVNQSLKYDSGVFKLVEAKTTSHYSVDYSNINMIKINRREASNDSAFIDYVFEITGLNGNASIEVYNQSGGCENSQLVQGEKLLFTAKIVSDNNFLDSVSFSSGHLDNYFTKDVTNYKLILPYDTTQINIVAKKNDNSSTITGDIGVTNLANKNKLVINVKSQYGNTLTYTFNIEYEKKDEIIVEDDSPYLKKITTSSGLINFNSTTYNYSINIPYSTTFVEVSAQPVNQNTTFQISGSGDMKVGLNTIRIITTSPQGKSVIYTINVTREAQDSTNSIAPNTPIDTTATNYLSSLEIENHPISFNKDIFDYYITLDDFNNLKINTKAETEGAIVTIQGNENLKNNSVISIIVTGLNGENREYRIIINSSDNSNSSVDNTNESSSNNNQNIVSNNNQTKTSKNNIFHNPFVIGGGVILFLILIYRLYAKTRRL